MTYKSNARPGYSDDPSTLYNGTVRHGTAPSTHTQRLPGGAVHAEPAQSASGSKPQTEYNLGVGREPSASTVGTPSRVTPVASDAARRVPRAYVKKSK